MPLLAYNKTTSPVTLAAGIPAPPVLPASSGTGVKGVPINVTSHLRVNLTVDPDGGVSGGLTAANLTALQAQVAAGTVEFLWVGERDYLTPGLTVLSLDMWYNESRWVSPDGSDETGDGSITNPWKSIQYAIDNVPDWGFVRMHPGSYVSDVAPIVDKTIFLIGDGVDNCWIEPSGSGQPGFCVCNGVRSEVLAFLAAGPANYLAFLAATPITNNGYYAILYVQDVSTYPASGTPAWGAVVVDTTTTPGTEAWVAADRCSIFNSNNNRMAFCWGGAGFSIKQTECNSAGIAVYPDTANTKMGSVYLYDAKINDIQLYGTPAGAHTVNVEGGSILQGEIRSTGVATIGVIGSYLSSLQNLGTGVANIKDSFVDGQTVIADGATLNAYGSHFEGQVTLQSTGPGPYAPCLMHGGQATVTPIDAASRLTRVIGIPDATTTARGLMSATDKQNLTNVGSYATETKEPSGFPNLVDSVISRVDGTLAFSIAPSGASFWFYVAGVKYTKSSTQSVNWTAAEGMHYFYFNSSGTLTHSVNINDWVNALLGNGALVAALYWDSTNSKSSRLEDERHGFMEGNTHLWMHQSQGARWISGGALGNFVIGNGSLDTHGQWDCGDVTIYDEDLRWSFVDGTPQDLTPILKAPVFYLSGAAGSWRKSASGNFPYIYPGKLLSDGVTPYAGIRVPFNQFSGGAWVLTDPARGNYVLVHLFTTNDVQEPVIAIQGQAQYTTGPAAQAGAKVELASLQQTIVLLGHEACPLGTVILQTSDLYANVPKARVIQTTEGGNYVDFRSSQIVGNAALVTDHENLSGRNTGDQHTQYALENLIGTHVIDTAGLQSSDGAGMSTVLYDVDYTAGAMMVGLVPKYWGAGNDIVLVGAGSGTIPCYELNGTAGVVIAGGNGFEKCLALVAVIVSGAVTLYGIFGAEAATPNALQPTASQIKAALAAAGIAGYSSVSGLVWARIKYAQAAGVVTGTHTAVTDASLAEERAVGTVGTMP